MRAVNRSMLVLVLAAAGCGRPPAVAVLETPSTVTPPTAFRTPPTARAMPGLYPRPTPPAATTGDVPPALQKVFAERNQLHQRQTGAILTIDAKWVKHPRSAPRIHIDWTIDYDGPRRPFAILTPGEGNEEVVARFWHLGLDGTATSFTLTWGGLLAGVQPRKQKGMYSVSAGGGPVAGQLQTASDEVIMHKMGREPKPGDPPLWVQLEYAPTDRGDGSDIIFDPRTRRATGQELAWTFDAWTGKLWSPVVGVAIK